VAWMVSCSTGFSGVLRARPSVVRRWVTQRVGRRLGRDAVFDLEQELLLYLCSLSPTADFGKAERTQLDGCTDVIQCFDPFALWCDAARFHNFLNLCLRNRLSTILAKQRREPLHDPRNLSIRNSEAPPENIESPSEPGRLAKPIS